MDPAPNQSLDRLEALADNGDELPSFMDILAKEPQAIFVKSNLYTDTTSSSPLIFVAFQPVDWITKEEQLGFVDITTAAAAFIHKMNARPMGMKLRRL